MYFLKEQDKVEIDIERFKKVNRRPQDSKAKYVQLRRRLKQLVQTYNVSLDYL